MEDTRKKVIECFNSLGFVVDDDDTVDILDYLDNSITYISFIVEVESTFDIEIPDEYLLQGRMRNIGNVCDVVEMLKKE